MRAMILRPWVLLLAAGGSGRYGGVKLLARVNGISLLRRAASTALAARPAGCVVVLGAAPTRLRRELQGMPLRVVVNRRWREGLASSLRTGLRALPASAPAVLVMLADQAALRPDSLDRLQCAWRRTPNAIVAAWNGEVRGPPAIFPRSMFRALRRLRGDSGARALLTDRRRRVLQLELPEAAIDVDRPGDRARIDWQRG